MRSGRWGQFSEHELTMIAGALRFEFLKDEKSRARLETKLRSAGVAYVPGSKERRIALVGGMLKEIADGGPDYASTLLAKDAIKKVPHYTDWS